MIIIIYFTFPIYTLIYFYYNCSSILEMGLNGDKCGFGGRIRRRDVRNLGRTIQEFISKLPYTPLASSLRDALLYTALQLSRYNRSQCDNSFTDTQVSIPLSTMKLLNESYPEIDQDLFKMKWERERDNSNLTRSHTLHPDVCIYAANGDFTGIERVLQTDMNAIDCVDSFGRSALVSCCRHSSPDHMTCLEVLLQYNAAMDLPDNEGVTALHWAAYTGNADAVRSLLRHGASTSITDKNGRSALHMATQSETPRVLELLLQQTKIDFRVKDCRGLTPLFWAAARDNIDAVNKLKLAESNSFLSRDTLMTDAQGRSLIHWAAFSPYGTLCLESLITSDNCSLQDTLGWTPLHYTALTGSQKSCQVILNVISKDRIDTLTKHGFSALHIACYHGNGDVLDSLLSSGGDYLSPTPEGSTPLETVSKLKLYYSQLVLETHISQCRRSSTPKNRDKPVCNPITAIPNHMQTSLTPTPPLSPKPPTSPKNHITPLRHRLKTNTREPKSNTRSLPPQHTPTLAIIPDTTNILSNLEVSVSSQKLLGRSRPVSAKGRIRPVQSSKRPPSIALTTSPLAPEYTSRRSTPSTPPSPQQNETAGMRRTFSYGLNLDKSDQLSSINLPPRPHAPTPPLDSDPDSVVISEASSCPPLAPEEIESATSILGLPVQKRQQNTPISEILNLNDSGFVSPIPKSPSTLSMRKHRPSLNTPHSLQYDSYNRQINTQIPSPYNQAMTLPNTPQSKRSLTKNPYDTITNPTQFPTSQSLLAARSSNIPRYNSAWKPTKEHLPSQRPVLRINRPEARISTSQYNH